MRRNRFEAAGSRTPDVGGRTLTTASGEVWHSTSPAVAGALRYAVSRWQVQHKGGAPTKLAVSSALRGEGVSFIGRSLADIMASDLQRSVCLVDLNWWHPSTPPRSPEGPGLAEVLRQEVALEDALSETGNVMLRFLGAGSAEPSERPALAQGAELRELVDDLTSRFDHIVLDVPAVRSRGESLPLAGLADGALLVVRHGVTTTNQVRSALADLAFVPVLGVVLNRVSTSTPRWLAERVGA